MAGLCRAIFLRLRRALSKTNSAIRVAPIIYISTRSPSDEGRESTGLGTNSRRPPDSPASRRPRQRSCPFRDRGGRLGDARRKFPPRTGTHRRLELFRTQRRGSKRYYSEFAASAGQQAVVDVG